MAFEQALVKITGEFHTPAGQRFPVFL